MEIIDAGIAYDKIYDVDGNRASSSSFLNSGSGLSRFCSASLIPAHRFGSGRGLEDALYFTGEETSSGALWALDPSTSSLWHVPDMGRGSYENVAQIDTGTTTDVAFIMCDDNTAPLYLYIGQKNPTGDILSRNGLRGGKMYVLVSNTGELSASSFNGHGSSLKAAWVQIDNTRILANAGTSGYDKFGYPSQSNLFAQASAVAAYQFARLEDASVNPLAGNEAAIATTGTGGADKYGTVEIVRTNFTDLSSPTALLTIVYDGDADSLRLLRSVDNIEWSADGKIYAQEDKATSSFSSTNTDEAGIVQLDPLSPGAVARLADMKRSVVLDGSIATPSDAVDRSAGSIGAWESSGIVDVSAMFYEEPGHVFLFTVQAHGITSQTSYTVSSKIVSGDLVEGGQLLVLKKVRSKVPDPCFTVTTMKVSNPVR
jgi:hypothetical protein